MHLRSYCCGYRAPKGTVHLTWTILILDVFYWVPRQGVIPQRCSCHVRAIDLTQGHTSDLLLLILCTFLDLWLNDLEMGVLMDPVGEGGLGVAFARRSSQCLCLNDTFN